LVAIGFTIEIIETLGMRASNLLEHLGYKKKYLKIDYGYKGWPEQAPFDATIVTCAPSAAIPKPLQNQIAKGGRIIIACWRGKCCTGTVIDQKNEREADRTKHFSCKVCADVKG